MLKYYNVESTKIACWINTRDFGTKKQSLVFIHGSGSDHSVWSHQYARLHPHYNVLAIDLPGHGHSEGTEEVAIENYCHQVKNILDVVNLQSPILIGHSLGAAITLSYAIHYPQRISGIATIGGGIKMPVNASLLQGLKTNPAEAIELFCKYALAKQNREKFMEPLIKSFMHEKTDVLHSDLTACDKLDLTQEISKISLSTLVICGAEDKMTPPEYSRQVATSITGAKLVLIEGAGHMVMMEKPLELNEALNKFAATIADANL